MGGFLPARAGVTALRLPPGGGDKGPRKRKASSPAGQGEGDTRSETSEVTVETLRSVQTDFSPDTLQKAVRVSADHALLATGGTDGFLRLWEVGAGPRAAVGQEGAGAGA